MKRSIIFLALLVTGMSIIGYMLFKKTERYDYMHIPDGELVKSEKISQFKLRKYPHVTALYQMMTKEAINICLKHNIPPAALLAIAGLESGWNRGYVGKITGNILAIGAGKTDTTLPALRLPKLKSTGQILYDSLEIIKYSDDELIWKKRPRSKKKDYRPGKLAGSKYNLAYFKYHPKERSKAYAENINDFIQLIIDQEKNIKAYKETIDLMNKLVKTHGKKTLLTKETTYIFINGIGGKRNSYNYRKSWVRKVKSIIKHTGLIELVNDLYNGKSFEESW